MKKWLLKKIFKKEIISHKEQMRIARDKLSELIEENNTITGTSSTVVVDNSKTEELLKTSGYICNVTDVVAACVDDKPGALAKEIAVLTEAGVEVEYLYAFVTTGKQACVVLRVNDTALAEATLTKAGVKLLQEADMKNM